MGAVPKRDATFGTPNASWHVGTSGLSNSQPGRIPTPGPKSTSRLYRKMEREGYHQQSESFVS